MDKQSLAGQPVLFLASWYALTLITLAFAILLLTYLSSAQLRNPTAHNFKLYSALPDTSTTTEDAVIKEDGRSKIIEDFFKGYNSVLANYSSTFIQVADKYNLDYKLMPAIAMQESNGAKRVIADSFNPFGYGIYGGNVKRFKSWDEAIERVGRGLRDDYLNAGLNTPDKIMAKYTPPALKDGGSWAKGVKSFMAELR